MTFRQSDLDDFEQGTITYDELVERHNAYIKSLENNDEDEDKENIEDLENKDDKKYIEDEKNKKDEKENKDKSNDDKTKTNIEDPEYLKFLELKKQNKIIIKEDKEEEMTLDKFLSDYNNNINNIKEKKKTLTDESAEALLKEFYKNKDMEEDDITSLIERIIANNSLIDKASALLDKEINALETNKQTATDNYKKEQESIKVKKEKEMLQISESMKHNLSKTKVFGESLTEKEIKSLSEKVLTTANYFNDLFTKDPSLFYKIIIAIDKGYFTDAGLNKLINRNAHKFIKDDFGKQSRRNDNNTTSSNNP